MNKFGEALRRERKKARKTLDDVARVVGCAVSYVSDVELSRRKPFKLPKIMAIAELLGCDPQPLIVAAAHENGAVTITAANPRVTEIAAGLARSGERLAPAALEEIARILREAEED